MIKNYKKLLFFLAVFVCFFSCKKNEIKEAHIPFNKNYKDLSSELKKQYLDSLVLSLSEKENDSTTRSICLEISTEYYNLNDIKKSYLISHKALDLSKKANDKLTIAKSYYYIGDCFENTYRDSAYFYYFKAQKIYKSIFDDENEGRMLFNKAHVLFYSGSYIECEIQCSKALKKIEKTNDYELVLSNLTLMGNCLEKLGKDKESLKYHTQALNILKKMSKSKIGINKIEYYNASSVINICNLYDKKGEYVLSIKNLTPLLTKSLRKNWPKTYSNILGNLAYSKMKNGETKDVESLFRESLRISDSIGIDSDIMYKKINFGEYYLKKNDLVKANRFFLEAYNTAIQIKSTDYILITLSALSKTNKNRSQYYFEEYVKINDILNSDLRKTSDKYARIEYETFKIEDENKLLSKKVRSTLLILLISTLVLLSIILLIHIRHRKKEYQTVILQKKASDEIYSILSQQQKKINAAKNDEKSRIAQELHDGIMNRIYSIRMNLGFFNSKKGPEIAEKRKFYIDELQNIEKEIRIISHDLNRDLFFEENEFLFLIQGMIESHKNVNNIKFKFKSDESIDWTKINTAYKLNIYRIMQEVLFNVIKYSNAKKCEISIDKSDDNLILTIIDDGDGFDIEQSTHGIGFKNIEERIKTLKGKLNIKTAHSEGTMFEFIFPVSL